MKKNNKIETKKEVKKDFEYYFDLTKGYIMFIVIVLAIAYVNGQEQKTIRLTGTLSCSELTRK